MPRLAANFTNPSTNPSEATHVPTPAIALARCPLIDTAPLRHASFVPPSRILTPGATACSVHHERAPAGEEEPRSFTCRAKASWKTTALSNAAVAKATASARSAAVTGAVVAAAAVFVDIP